MLHRKHLPIVDPCRESWSAMTGDELRRFCGVCEREVVDLSRLTLEAALDELEARAGTRICVRYTVDRAGEIRFAPEPPAWRAAPAVALAGALLAACTGHGGELEVTPPDDAGGWCSAEDEAAGRCEGPGPAPAPPSTDELAPEPVFEEPGPVADTPSPGRACESPVDAVPVPEREVPRDTGQRATEYDDIILGGVDFDREEIRRHRRE